MAQETIAKVPPLRIGKNYLGETRAQALESRAFEILRKNRRTTGGHQYTVPSPSVYPYQWLWDSCFHAIALSHVEPEAAKAELRSLVAKQFESGMIPHMIYWEENDAINIKWGKDKTSSITQPPLLAQAALEVSERSHDIEFLKELYPALYHFYNYLLSERDPRRHHLAGIINPDESGEDNSPRFDQALKLPAKQTREESFNSRLELVAKLQSCNFDAPFCMKKFFWVKDVPFNAILVRSLDALVKISELTGNSEEGLVFAEQALKIRQAMREMMLQDGLYYSVFGDTYEKIRTKTWAIFMPLFAGLLSPEEAQVLVQNHLHNNREFRTTFCIPTVARDEESYDPRGFWRGSVWMASNWFLYRGLVDFGFREDAQMILESTANLLERSGFREYYHPDTGEGQGATDFTWGALIIDMMRYEGATLENHG